MASKSFEFMRGKHADLVDYAAAAEAYAWADPQSALFKLRNFTERVTAFIYVAGRLPQPFNANLNDLLNGASFCDAVPTVVRSKLHLLRKHGNKKAFAARPPPSARRASPPSRAANAG